jgi:hypothetical protein
MSIVVVGQLQVGKSFLVEKIRAHFCFSPIHEIQDLRDARPFLQSLRSFVLVFVITLEGGRLQAHDAQLFQLFATRRDCLVLINKAPFDVPPRDLSSRISSYFLYPVILRSLCFQDNTNVSKKGFAGLEQALRSLVPRPFEMFLSPDEEKDLLNKQRVEQEEHQRKQLQQETREKERLWRQEQAARQQLIVQLRELEKQDNWKGFDLPITTVSERMTTFPSEDFATATMWSDHSKEFALLHQEGLLCRNYCLTNPRDPCYGNSGFTFREFKGKKYLVAVNG